MPKDRVPLQNRSEDDGSAGLCTDAQPHPNGTTLNGTADRTQQDLHFPEICYRLRAKLLTFLEEQPTNKTLQAVQGQVRISMDVIDQALQRYTRLDELALSYNGGKDCLVLLILILACLPARTPFSKQNGNTSSASASTNPVTFFQAIYIVPPDPFPEVDAFVVASTKEYHLDLQRYALPMRPALDAYLDDHKTVKAIFMGTRRTDPHSEFLTHFTPTDVGWPQFMRVNPVIDWHYTEIWAFIRHLDIPFCSLYNKGFTSLGGTTNTWPNPSLATNDDANSYRPAYELVADDEERLGRGR